MKCNIFTCIVSQRLRFGWLIADIVHFTNSFTYSLTKGYILNVHTYHRTYWKAHMIAFMVYTIYESFEWQQASKMLYFGWQVLHCIPCFDHTLTKCQTPLHGHRLRTCCTTPPTDELTTILQLVVHQIHHKRTKICYIPTSWHVDMLGSGIAMWQNLICCTTTCRIVVSLYVSGVVQHARSRCPCSGVWH